VTPELAYQSLIDHVHPIGETESIGLQQANGRFLRTAIRADRDSPAAHVSAMDGYAARHTDLSLSGPLAVTATSAPGHAPPPAPPPQQVVRIYTGGIVPPSCDVVIRREDVLELKSEIRWTDAARQATLGRDIRRQAENGKSGSIIVPEGKCLSPTSIAAAATFGQSHLQVTRLVRVAIITTGDELLDTTSKVEAWQVRDSNGPMLRALLDRPHLQRSSTTRVRDDLQTLVDTLHHSVASADLVLITGGASMGDHDYVPEAVRAIGARVLFHRLPQRPGQPLLGAATGDGKPIIGLPGNPASALVGTVRYALPISIHLAGGIPPTPSMVTIDHPDHRSLPMTWFRAVNRTHPGRVALVPTQGSGDVVSLAQTDGFVVIPPDTPTTDQPVPYWPIQS
jgi:molybdopterin molybdotransferase